MEAQTSLVKSCSLLPSPFQEWDFHAWTTDIPAQGLLPSCCAPGGLRSLNLLSGEIPEGTVDGWVCPLPFISFFNFFNFFFLSTACFFLEEICRTQLPASLAVAQLAQLDPGRHLHPFPAGREGSQAVQELRLLLLHLRRAQNVAFGALLLGKHPQSCESKAFLRADISSCACSHLLCAQPR